MWITLQSLHGTVFGQLNATDEQEEEKENADLQQFRGVNDVEGKEKVVDLKHQIKFCMFQVKDSDQLPQQLCLGCVSELNKCFAFREKCVRTDQTLRTYLDLDEDESEIEEFVVMTPKKKKTTLSRDSKEDRYEEIEVTQEMVDAAKSQNQIGDSLVLEMEEINNLLNPTSAPASDKSQGQNDNELVFIIQNVGDNSGSTHLIQTNQLQEEAAPSGTSKDSFKCTTCEMVFVRKKNFDNHMKRFHENDDEVAPEKKRLRLKLTQESNKDELKRNLEENPEAKRCKICGALYMNEKSLKLHERRNACQQESYQCNVCSKVFTDQKVFTDHTQNHPQQQQTEETFDPDRKFQCTVCPRAFKMLSTLKDHSRTHTGDKPFVCTICGRGFSQNTNLKQHLRRHTQVKPFRCDHETCSASFVSKGELDSHSRVHTGQEDCLIIKRVSSLF